MSPERWSRVEGAFLRCLERPSAERPALVQKLCGDDNDLQREVDSLLEAHARAENFQPGGAAVRPVLEALETEYYLGRTLGGYRIEAFVGRGSTGSVYRAIDSATNTPVAIKILAPELLVAEGALHRMRERVRAVSAIRQRRRRPCAGSGGWHRICCDGVCRGPNDRPEVQRAAVH